MDEGRLPYNTYARCTDKTLRSAEKGVARADYCGGVRWLETGGAALCMSSATAVSDQNAFLRLCFDRCVNALLCAGAVPKTLSVHMHIPPDMEEQTLRRCIQHLDALCAAHGMTLLPASLLVTGAVSAPCVVLESMGERIVNRKAPKPGDALIQVRSAGLSGTGLLLTLEEERLSARFSERFLLQARAKLCTVDVSAVTTLLNDRDVYLLPVAEGGVLAALWDFKTAAGLGFEVDLRAVPMEQEVVEITGFLDVNPYRLAGDGALFLVTDAPEEALLRLGAAGIPAAVIGSVTKGPAGNIKKDDEISSVSRPEQDALFAFL